MKLIITILSVALATSTLFAQVHHESQKHHGHEYHVSIYGDDQDKGTRAKPFRTISAAAAHAQPGDTVIVHAGTYREWVKPPRGGTSDDKRITYRGAKGEQVIIKGSEQIKNWNRQESGVWKVELPNTFFGDYNPYALKLTGDWLAYGQWHHRGDVYLNGKAFHEKQTDIEVGDTVGSWFCRTDEKTTTIIANFGESDPNKETVEINVRESLFMPVISGLKYITIDGFHFRHAASNWSPPNIELQPGAVGTRMGKRWIIQNCSITDCRTVGIILGNAPDVDHTDIDAFGDHVIRNNIIKRCGQAGIAGLRGATRSMITRNFIEDINYRKEFGGQETAAIKFHLSVDTTISNNLIRGVFCKDYDAHGIWIDAANQSTRISGNIIYNTDRATIFVEVNHGPILIDNNILIGHYVKSNSRGVTYAHNLFLNCRCFWRLAKERSAHYYKPHTTKYVKTEVLTEQDSKWFNNIFVQRGLEDVNMSKGYESDYNLFLQGAKKSSFGDKNSIEDSHDTQFKIEERPSGVTVTFSVNDQFNKIKGPWVNADLVGFFTPVGQSIEDRYGNPITVDKDINVNQREQPIPGPLAKLKPGLNMISWDYMSHTPIYQIPNHKRLDMPINPE